MMGALPPDVRVRLIKLAGMLGSAFAAEREAAIGRCNDLLKLHHATWEEALTPEMVVIKAPSAPVSAAPPPPLARSWMLVVLEIQQFHMGALRVTARYNEPEFLQDIVARGRAPSPRQGKWLADIAVRCGVALWDDYDPDDYC